MARLGTWTATHLKAVLISWAAVIVAFGFFAPKVQSALAGAGWQDSTSQSVAARQVIQRDFAPAWVRVRCRWWSSTGMVALRPTRPPKP